MKIRKSYKIHGTKVKVKFEELEEELGSWDPAYNQIIIEPNQLKVCQQETLVHELLHAMVPDLGDLVGEEKEEFIIGILSRELYRFIKDNPGAFDDEKKT